MKTGNPIHMALQTYFNPINNIVRTTTILYTGSRPTENILHLGIQNQRGYGMKRARRTIIIIR